MDHQSSSSTLKTAIMASLASAKNREAESQPQRMQAKKRRSMFDYTSEMRDPVTIGTKSKTFSENNRQENCEHQNLECMQDLPTSINSVFSNANKSAVKIEEIEQKDKDGGEIFNLQKSKLFNDKPRFQNIKERQTFFPHSTAWFHLGSRNAPLVRDTRERILHPEFPPQTDSNVEFCQQDYTMQRQAMTNKTIVEENSNKKKTKESNSPTLSDAAERRFHHRNYDEATHQLNITTDNEDIRHDAREATSTCATESIKRKSLKDVRRETSRRAAAILNANKATLIADAQAAAEAAASTTNESATVSSGKAGENISTSMPHHPSHMIDVGDGWHIDTSCATIIGHQDMQKPCANEMAGYHRFMPAQVLQPTVRFAQQLVAGYHKIPETKEQCAKEQTICKETKASGQCEEEEEISEEEISRPDIKQIPHQATNDHQKKLPPPWCPSEPFRPWEPTNTKELRATNSNIKKQLNELQKERISNLYQDTRSRVNRYQDIFAEKSKVAPLFYGAWVIQNPDMKNVFMCKPCNGESLRQNNFRSHHTTKKHLSNLELWLDAVEQKIRRDKPMQKKPEIVAFEKESISRTRHAINVHRQATSIQYDHLEQQQDNNHTINNESEDFLDPVSENSDPILYNDKVYNQSNETVVFQETNASIETTFPVHDQSLDSGVFQKTIAFIEINFPVRFQRDVMNLINIFFFKRNEHSTKIQFVDTAYEGEQTQRHWIMKKFDKRIQSPNARQYLKEKCFQNDFDIVHKSIEQLFEIRNISNMAKLLFATLVFCEFVPTNYLILLSILMYGYDNNVYPERATTLHNGQSIDLLLNTGIVLLSDQNNSPDQDQEEEYPAMESDDKTAQGTSLNDPHKHINKDEFSWQTPLQNDINILHKGNQSRHVPNVDKENSILEFSSTSTSSKDIPSLDAEIQKYHLEQNTNQDPPDLSSAELEQIRQFYNSRIAKYLPDVERKPPNYISTSTSSTSIPSMDSDQISDIQRMYIDRTIIDEPLQDQIQDHPDLSSIDLEQINNLSIAASEPNTEDKIYDEQFPIAMGDEKTFNEISTILTSAKILTKKCIALKNKHKDMVTYVNSNYDNDHANDDQEVDTNHDQLKQEVVDDHDELVQNIDLPITVATSLFNHWIDKHHYHESLNEDRSGRFANEIILELARLVTEQQMNN